MSNTAKSAPSKPAPYARGTTIPVDKTVEELRKLLKRYGIEDLGHLERQGHIVLVFTFEASTGESRNVRFSVPMPERESLRTYKRGFVDVTRSDAQLDQAMDAERQRIYRALHAIIKARLIGYDEGIETFERVFFPETVADASGATVYEAANERVAEGYRTGRFPDLLPGLPPRAVLRAIPAPNMGDERSKP